MAKVDFKLDQTGGAIILQRNAKIRSMENQAMMSVLSAAKAQFFIDFKKEGEFEFATYTSDRYTAKVRAANKETQAILKRNPRWMMQFMDNIQI